MTSRESQQSFGYSIGVVFYREGEVLLKTLQGLMASVQALWELAPVVEIELLLVNNGSTDLEQNILNQLQSRLPPSTKVQRSPRNSMAWARQWILTEARYEQVIFLDADCVPSVSWLVNYHGYQNLFADPLVVGLGGENAPPRQSVIELYRWILRLKTAPQIFLGSTQLKRPLEIEEVRHLSTCNCLFKKSAVLAAGGVSSNFDRVGEDLELSARLIQRGYRLLFCPGLEVEHLDRNTLFSWVKKIFGYGRAQPRVLFRYPLAVDPRRWVPILILVLLIFGLLLAPALTLGLGVFLFMGVGIVIAGRDQGFGQLGPWLVFLGATVASYLLGIAFEVCTSFLPRRRY